MSPAVSASERHSHAGRSPGRSIRDLHYLVYEFQERGVTLKATERQIDTRTASGKAFFDMLGLF
jgi:DNA invertase Pin-like site-specific DNA recombinase